MSKRYPHLQRVVPEDEKLAGRIMLAILAALLIAATITWYRDREEKLERCAPLMPAKERYEKCLNPPVEYDPAIDDPGYGNLW